LKGVERSGKVRKGVEGVERCRKVWKGLGIREKV
jgi:hypothetical protein